jgi:hypothetical protein
MIIGLPNDERGDHEETSHLHLQCLCVSVCVCECVHVWYIIHHQVCTFVCVCVCVCWLGGGSILFVYMILIV